MRQGPPLWLVVLVVVGLVLLASYIAFPYRWVREVAPVLVA